MVEVLLLIIPSPLPDGSVAVAEVPEPRTSRFRHLRHGWMSHRGGDKQAGGEPAHADVDSVATIERAQLLVNERHKGPDQPDPRLGRRGNTSTDRHNSIVDEVGGVEDPLDIFVTELHMEPPPERADDSSAGCC